MKAKVRRFSSIIACAVCILCFFAAEGSADKTKSLLATRIPDTALAPSGPGLPSRADTVWYGYYTMNGDDPYAVPGETWTWDHGGADPLEGWTPIDMTRKQPNDTWWTWVESASFECPAEAPMINGSGGQLWLGRQQSYADSACWICDAGETCSLGYEGMLRQLVESPIFPYSSGGVNVGCDVVTDFETGYDFFTGRLIAMLGDQELDTVDSGTIVYSAGVPWDPEHFALAAEGSQMGYADGVKVVFEFVSDFSYSDSDGGYCSTYGACCLDNVAIST
ncbi:hypothetical protein ACFL6M_07170, partial [Candidatus Eisenbacteria bacterium]